MSTVLPFVIFVAALAALVKGADWLIEGAEQIGKYFGLPAFVIGALIVGVGTSLPEVASSLAAVFSGSSDIVVSNAVGSNIANILLVAGLAAVVGKRIVSTKNLLDIEVPLLLISSALFLGVVYDGSVSLVESALLFVGFLVYLSYLLLHPDESGVEEDADKGEQSDTLAARDFALLAVGGIALVGGANFLIQSVQSIATLVGISEGVVAITAVAVGTSLPEIIVSVTAVLQGKTDMAFGNVFGSNVFNVLMMVGIVGMTAPLSGKGILGVDPTTLVVGLPVFAAVTLMFVVSAMSKRIYIWEGLMFLVVYLFFVAKIIEYSAGV